MLKEMFGRRDTGHDDRPPSHSSSDSSQETWLVKQLIRGQRAEFTEKLRIGPAMAKTMLVHNTNNFRKHSAGTVASYARMMKEGRWLHTREGICFDRDGALLNGQHRLMAVIQSGETVSFTVWFGCDSQEAEVVDKPRVRGLGQLLHHAGTKNSNAIGSLGNLLDFVTDSKTAKDTGAMRNYIATLNATALQAAVQEGRRASKKLSHIAALSLAHYWIATGTARSHALLDFWNTLIEGGGTNRPLLKLRDTLLENRRTPVSREYTVGKTDYVVAVWNATAARRASATTFMRNDGKTLPKVI